MNCNGLLCIHSPVFMRLTSKLKQVSSGYLNTACSAVEYFFDVQ